MPEDACVQDYLLSLDAVMLGQLVLDTNTPYQDSHTSESLTTSDSRVMKKRLTSFSETVEHNKHSSRTGFLPIFGGKNKNDNRFLVRVESTSTNIHQLANPSDVFNHICKSPRTKKWIERAIGKGKKVHMIVGLHILSDAEITRGGFLDIEHDIGGVLKLSATPSPVELVVGCSGEGGELTRNDFQFVALGEHIYAIQYRRIFFKWYSSRRVEKAELEKPNWWKVFTRYRSADEDIEDDVIEAGVESDGDANGEQDIEPVSSS